MAVVAFINCDRPVIGLRLNQSRVMWRGAGGGSLMEDDCFCVDFNCLSVGKTEVCVYVCLRRHKAQNNDHFYFPKQNPTDTPEPLNSSCSLQAPTAVCR